MGHVKNWAQAAGAEDVVPRQRHCAPVPRRLLPETAARRLQPMHFAKHPLRREIIATAAVNYVINKAGVRFIFQMLSASRKDLGW